MPGQEFERACACELAGFWVESVGAAGIVKAMLCGGSSGAAVWAAQLVAKRIGPGKRIVVYRKAL